MERFEALPKRLLLVYNSFQTGDFAESLLKRVLVTNEVLNKTDKEYSYDLVVLEFIDV